MNYQNIVMGKILLHNLYYVKQMKIELFRNKINYRAFIQGYRWKKLFFFYEKNITVYPVYSAFHKTFQ